MTIVAIIPCKYREFLFATNKKEVYDEIAYKLDRVIRMILGIKKG